MGVDLSWKAGKATHAILRPDVSGDVTLRPPRGQRIARVTQLRRNIALETLGDGVVRLKLIAGREYRLTFA